MIQAKQVKHPMITINFYEHKNNEVKMIGVYAKKARGVMARFLIQNRVDSLEQIKEFTGLGYSFNKQTSSAQHLDFIRVH